jgi:hypothetical protein
MSDDKNLPAQLPANKPPQLHNNGLGADSIMNQALARLNPQQVENLMGEAAKKRVELDAKRLQQEIDHQAGRMEAQSHIDTVNMLPKNGLLTSQKVTSHIKTGAGKMDIESRSGLTCFVASAAYSDPNHPDVMFLRAFRDNVLIKSCFGRSVVDWYWRIGPRLARVVESSEVLRSVSKYLISKLVVTLQSRAIQKVLRFSIQPPEAH